MLAFHLQSSVCLQTTAASRLKPINTTDNFTPLGGSPKEPAQGAFGKPLIGRFREGELNYESK